MYFFFFSIIKDGNDENDTGVDIFSNGNHVGLQRLLGPDLDTRAGEAHSSVSLEHHHISRHILHLNTDAEYSQACREIPRHACSDSLLQACMNGTVNAPCWVPAQTTSGPKPRCSERPSCWAGRAFTVHQYTNRTKLWSTRTVKWTQTKLIYKGKKQTNNSLNSYKVQKNLRLVPMVTCVNVYISEVNRIFVLV